MQPKTYPHCLTHLWLNNQGLRLRGVPCHSQHCPLLCLLICHQEILWVVGQVQRWMMGQGQALCGRHQVRILLSAIGSMRLRGLSKGRSTT